MSICENCPVVNFIKTLDDAVIPTKGEEMAVGYDLTAVRVKKQQGKTIFFDTGIQVEPPQGYYTEIIPRSSLSKTGYILANSVGIIDPCYRGNLIIALTKVDDSKPDLELPFKRCQLVLRKCEFYAMKEVVSLSETERGSGGFGSTD